MKARLRIAALVWAGDAIFAIAPLSSRTISAQSVGTGVEMQNGVSIAQTKNAKVPDQVPENRFNPDPGVSTEVEPTPIPELFPAVPPHLPKFGEEPLPRSLQLPRTGLRETIPYRHKLEYERYGDTDLSSPESSRPISNRWFIGFGRWQRYADPSAETPYQSDLKLWHPYLQSALKGD